MKFAFVILHYQTYSDTLDCVNSLSIVDYPNVEIVIIDNGSPNRSGELLKHKFSNNPRVHFLPSQTNVGFARGNNIGFYYAKHTLHSDFIALINNDTFIDDALFVTKIINKYKHSPFHILGPRVISSIDGSDQSPRTNKDWNRQKSLAENVKILQARIDHYKKMKALASINLDTTFIKIKKKIFRNSWLPSSGEVAYHPSQEIEDVKINGCAIIFSPLYLEKYEGLYDRTFMYGEESILHYISNRDQLKTIYFPDVILYHKESSSTKTVLRNKAKRRIFYYKNFIQSRSELLNLMKDEL